MNSAWAAGEIALTTGNTIGATDNSTPWYGQASEIVQIGHHQTLTLKFKTYTATDEQLKGKGENGADKAWGDQLTHVINMWDGRGQNFFMKGCGWGWKDHNKEVNDPVDYDVNNTTYAYYQKNVGWANDYRTMIGNGADVVMTIQRFGTKFRITQEFTTSTGAKYQHYFVGTFGTESGDVWCQMTVENAHVDITADKELTTSSNPTILGTLIGSEDNTTAWWTQFSDYFSLKANDSMSLKIKNYSNKVNNYNNFVAYVTSDADRGSCTEYMGLRADKWVLVANAEATHNYLTACPNSAGTDIDWDAFREKMDGATVTITVSRSGESITTTANIEPADGSTTLTESYTKECGDGTQDVRVFLAIEGGHLDLLPVSKEITSAGWATFCSPYALDLSRATGLEDAYIVTGGKNGVLAKTSVKEGTVPANTGLLLKGAEGTATIPIVGSSSTDVRSNKLVGKTTAEKIDAGSGWVLMNDATNGLGFYQNTNAFTVGANTAYLPADFDKTGSGARAFYSLFDSETTGVGASLVNSERVNNEVFNLQGQRVGQPTKGLYIVGGKKVVVK
jgi:hypothetical protein